MKIVDMNEYTSKTNKHYHSNPLKRLLRISGKTVVIIDEKLVNQLDIAKNDNIWVEQSVTDQGIMLKIRRLSREVRTC